ncbi:penicillin-binding transpeptidase domain-containing protein [Actinomadura harenae]|uniref:penicillin-binding transpeptidase domain-containing protein n=1 Tax=Actinomadura harenae TaxID=2483351 RepID=UPI0013150D83|nr:penicillin-binding transpeptidase domain-containing protein [Actinomadura harenae]
MGGRGIGCLAGVLVLVLGAGGCEAWALTRRDAGGPEKTAASYFAAWSNGDLSRMRGLVAHAPDGFVAWHKDLTSGLSVMSVALAPDPVVRTGTDSARADFTVTRNLAGHGDWTFRSTLLLRRHGHRWRVQWTPGTLYPGLKDESTSWTLRNVKAPAVAFVAADGSSLPGGSLDPYVSALDDTYGDSGDDDSDGETSSWAVEVQQGSAPPQRLKVFGGHPTRTIHTTFDLRVQKAAERALIGAPPGKAAAIVAVRPSTGEILAVADRLGGRGAFVSSYPPGSTFKVVTAAALMAKGGLSPSSAADCPSVVVTAQRTIHNHEGTAAGGATLADAFARSCNTTFAKLAVDRLAPGGLADTAAAYGFGAPVLTGAGGSYRDFPDVAPGADLAESAIGQGRVQATPLLMASVAAAVEDGTWRPPRLLPASMLKPAGGDSPPEPHDVPSADALRAMMRRVVTDGTASSAGLPPGTSGKTGTAEYNDSGASHAWFIGFKGDLAFSVFVQQGDSGPKVAAPMAAVFLRSL